MTSYNALVVVVVLLVVGHVQSRVASGASAMSLTGHDEDPPCLNVTSTSLLMRKLTCFEPLSTLKRQLALATDTAKYREVIQLACGQAPTVRTCLDGLHSEATTCLSDMEAKLFKATRENADVLFSAVCEDDSDSVAQVMGVEFKQWFKALSSQGKVSELRQCLRNAMLSAHLFNVETEDTPAYTMRKYRALKEVRKCIVDIASQVQVPATNFEMFSDKLVRGMKCISPVTKDIALCASLE